MKKFTLLLFSLLFAATLSFAQTDTTAVPDSTDAVLLEECVITFYRANKSTPITYKNIDAKELNEKSVGQEPAFLLNQTPSVNSYSDAGNMVGYSYFRLRGIDQTRINMTWDGVPLNEGEDQGVYFNNYPDFINSVSSIQIQRGIGTSSNGVASYGGSINFQSPLLFGDTSLQVGIDYGSYNTHREYVEYYSGKRKNFGFYIRGSNIHTDGYKEHSGNDSRSVLFSTGYVKNKHLLKLTGFIGHQKNDMVWLGSPMDSLKANPRYNTNFENEKDNFLQSLVKLQHTYFISDKSKLSSTVYYNHLQGNYDFDLNAFLELPEGAIDSAVYNYNLVHNFVGAFVNYSYTNKAFKFYTGIHGNTFQRTHLGSEAKIGELYTNTGTKNEYSGFAKATYDIKGLVFFADVSYRHAEFSYEGDATMDKMQWDFITPHAGLQYKMGKNTFYYSIGTTSREPSRTDIFYGEDNLMSDSLGNGIYSNIVPEEVLDHELGYRYFAKKGHIFANLYHMQFENEIALNGQFGPNGIALHSNVAESTKSGIELDVQYDLTKRFGVRNNSSFSMNRITEDGVQFEPILTPAIIVNQDFYYKYKNLYLCFNARYQSKSYLDFGNDLELPEFYTINAAVGYKFHQFDITVRGNNLTNQKYYSHGHLNVYGDARYFVQAPTNFYISLKWTL